MSLPHDAHELVGRCWSCQHDLRFLDAVILRREPLLFVPCCLTCWEQIPPSQRLVIAEKFHSRNGENGYRATMLEAIEAAGQSVEALLRGIVQLGHDEDDGDAWKRQSLN